MSDSTDKYNMANLSYHKSVLDMSEREYYKNLVETTALNFLDYNRTSIIELLAEESDFDRYDRRFQDSFESHTLDEVSDANDTKARTIMDYAREVEEDPGYLEGSDNPTVSLANRSFSNDVATEVKSFFEAVKDHYDQSNEKIDAILEGICSGKTQADPNDIRHVVAVEAYAEWMDFEGSFSDKADQIKQLDEITVTADYMELSQQFSANLAFTDQVTDVKELSNDHPVVPGSIQEAAVISAYLDLAESSSFGGAALGSAYMDSRTDDVIESYIFVEYQDKQAKNLLGLYAPDVMIRDHEIQIEASALSAAYAASKTAMTPEGISIIETAKSAKPEPLKPKGDFRLLIGNTEALQKGDLGREITQSDFELLGASRNCDGLSISNLKTYFAVMHPEAARVYTVNRLMSQEGMATLITGLIDGSAGAKDRLEALKNDVNEAVSPAQPALKAFRANIEKAQSPKVEAPAGPSI